jgi:hypothetical protein
MNKKIILIIVYIITNQSLYERLSPFQSTEQLLAPQRKMVCQKCDLPSRLFNSPVSHRFLPPPYTRRSRDGILFEVVCLHRIVLVLEGIYLSPLYQDNLDQG